MNSFVVALRPALRALAVAITLALAAAGLGVLTSPAQAASGSSSVMSMSSDTYEGRVQYWINKKRANRGLGKLRMQTCTDGTAERWAKYLATNDEFFHQDMGYVLDRCDAYYAGETLGRGSISPRHLVRLWMESPAHKDVLLSRSARRIGVGSYIDSVGQWVTAANFTKLG